jgi:hypothetical protein
MVLIAAAILITGYFVLNRPDQRDPLQKVGDAINALPHGVDKAARQLNDRTPGDKINDAAKDAKQDVKDFVNQP